LTNPNFPVVPDARKICLALVVYVVRFLQAAYTSVISRLSMGHLSRFENGNTQSKSNLTVAHL
jgi:hypothetical protein